MNFFSSPDPLGGRDGGGSDLDKLDRPPGTLADRYSDPNDTPSLSVSPKTKKSMQKLFLVVLLVGLGVGGVVAVGTVILLQQLGLTGVPAQSSPGR